MLGKSPTKWRQRPDMIIAVDWDVKHQFKQTNKPSINLIHRTMLQGCRWVTFVLLYTELNPLIDVKIWCNIFRPKVTRIDKS